MIYYRRTLEKRRSRQMKTKLKIYFGKNLEYYQVRQKCYFGMGFGFRLFKRRWVFAIVREWVRPNYNMPNADLDNDME